MTQEIYSIPTDFPSPNTIDAQQYEKMYQESINEPEVFWSKVAKDLDWFKEPTQIKDVSFDPNNFHIRWFHDGELNASVNCLDRHLAERGDKIAIIWEPDDPEQSTQKITYRQLYERVCQLANAMRRLGLKKGDRVTVYLPMVPDAVVALLACARIGVIHNVVFGGFSPAALADRIRDSASSLLITADEGRRAGRKVALKSNADAALKQKGTETVKNVLVLRHTGTDIAMQTQRDIWWHEAVVNEGKTCEPERMNAEDPLFILYTSGSTGKPKGVLHTTGGYLVQASFSHKTVFDLREDDVFWCTADVGWVTGHSYIVYGPLANGVTEVMFEGVPSYPDNTRFWQVIDKHQVSIFYTAPTALRALMRDGNEPVKKYTRKSLRLLGTVGEPINPEAWRWYSEVVGDGRLPIVDTWWQTETGAIMITPLPGAIATKPGSAGQPFFGVKPQLIDFEGNFVEGEGEGNLVITDSWPAQARTVYGDHQRFIDTYFAMYPKMYFTGDGCRRDKDGYYWITGRVDDVINVSGHRIGTAELESALVLHPDVSEAAAVGFNHAIKGQGIYVYVTLKGSVMPSEDLRKELMGHVRKEIGPIATPDFLQWAPSLPKTRSGKIMRRILRKIAENAPDQLGDTSTLAEPSVVDDLVQERLNKAE